MENIGVQLIIKIGSEEAAEKIKNFWIVPRLYALIALSTLKIVKNYDLNMLTCPSYISTTNKFCLYILCLVFRGRHFN